ncbi:MAG: hypothetical protein IPQ16_04270 [Geobacteraceae bacterium]|nr:hypothetical protein [Geobacteraceae bacterium]
MPVCELCDTCLFFNDKMPDMPAVAGFLKDKYCRGTFEVCARFQVYREFGREHVPDGLFPNESDILPGIVDGLRRRLKN